MISLLRAMGSSIIRPSVVGTALLVLYSAALSALAVTSLSWRLVLDAPCMLYFALLMERFHMVPYRDFMDMNLPGAHAAYLVIARLTGYSDLGARVVDLGLLSLLCVLMGRWMRPFGRLSAWGAPVIFGVQYLSAGPNMSLQREFLVIVVLAISLTLAVQPGVKLGWRAFLSGAILGVCATIKPHALVAAPCVVLLLTPPADVAGDSAPKRQWLRVLAMLAAGVCLPCAVAAAHIVATGAAAQFTDMVLNVWRLYGHLTGGLRLCEGSDRISYLATKFEWGGGMWAWWLPALAGAWIATRMPRPASGDATKVLALVVLAAGFTVYPALSGQFFGYHYLPLRFAMSLLGALCLTPWMPVSPRVPAAGPVCLLAIVMMTHIHGRPDVLEGPGPPMGGRVDAIASFLRAECTPGDRVQPMDWTSGALHAMLLARVRVATPFVTDVYLYLRPSDPYVQRLRTRFISQLDVSKPRFIVWIDDYNIVVPGESTRRPYRQLRDLMHRDYRTVWNRPNMKCRIYERRSDRQTGPRVTGPASPRPSARTE